MRPHSGVCVESQVDEQIIGLSSKCHSNGYNIDVSGSVVYYFLFQSMGIVK